MQSETGIVKNEFFEEIWRVREKLAAWFDYDLHRMVVHLQKQQATKTVPDWCGRRDPRLPATAWLCKLNHLRRAGNPAAPSVSRTRTSDG